MTTIEIITIAVAYLAAASRLVQASRPLWALLPPRVARVAPSVALGLALLVERLAGVETGLGAVESVLAVAGLVLPGALAHDDKGGASDEDVVK